MVKKLASSLSPARLLVPAALALALATLAPTAAFGVESEDKTSFSVAAGTLKFSSAPAMPTLPTVTLNGEAQTTNATMTNFGVADATGSGAGWNVTVNGQSGSGKSAVFAQYCPKATCGADKEGYVASGATLPANSLTLTSTGASFTGEKGSKEGANLPTLQCSSACNVDSASAVKIASAAKEAGMGTFKTGGWSGTSLALSTPSTLKLLANEEVYRVNLLWTLSTGP